MDKKMKVVCGSKQSSGVTLSEFVVILWILRFSYLLGEELHWDTARPAGWNSEWL